MFDHLHDNVVIAALVDGRYGDPFAVLGPHETSAGIVIRSLLPGALKVELLAQNSDVVIATISPVYDDILFEARLEKPEPYRLKIDWNGVEQTTEDPYSFPPLLSDFDLHLLAEGKHRDLAACLGAQVLTIGTVTGVRFAVWAPSARRVSVVGDFNSWDGRRHPMRLRHNAGVWELFIPRLHPGLVYKYEILGENGILPLKADPIARQVEISPATASIVSDPLMPEQYAPPRWRTETLGIRQAALNLRSPCTIMDASRQRQIIQLG